MNRLSQLAISDEGFIFDPVTGESFTVNSVGLEIISRLRKNKDEGKIAHELAEEYNIDINNAERDVDDFITHLRTYKLF